jgi:uncharacterized protein (DUF433 family)
MTTQRPMITCTPGVQGGYPCIKGIRTPVRTIVELYRDIYPGDFDEIMRALPHLTREQVDAAMRYYKECPELVDEDIRTNEMAIKKIITIPVDVL